MSSKNLQIDVLHPRRVEPIETISRSPRTTDDGSMIVNYNSRQYAVLELGGRNVIYINRPLGSKHKPRQPAMA